MTYRDTPRTNGSHEKEQRHERVLAQVLLDMIKNRCVVWNNSSTGRFVRILIPLRFHIMMNGWRWKSSWHRYPCCTLDSPHFKACSSFHSILAIIMQRGHIVCGWPKLDWKATCWPLTLSFSFSGSRVSPTSNSMSPVASHPPTEADGKLRNESFRYRIPMTNEQCVAEV